MQWRPGLRQPCAALAVGPGARRFGLDGDGRRGADADTVHPGRESLRARRGDRAGRRRCLGNESLVFRLALEAKYRDGLRRSAVSSYVDAEGTVVWVQEYLRYRVNLCSHGEAILRVFRQIDGFGVQPVCGTTATAIFPPRQEPLDFMLQLEAKYRDGLRRQPGTSFVDVEGNVIWTQEYLRYRAGACSHTEAQQKVFDQIDGRGVQPTCTPVLTVIAAACACALAPIEIRIDSAIVGSMACAETRNFNAPTTSYLVTACARNGCFGGNYFGPFTGSATIRLIC
jgi:hypothetical protein